jgi:hypothetical protein
MQVLWTACRHIQQSSLARILDREVNVFRAQSKFVEATAELRTASREFRVLARHQTKRSQPHVCIGLACPFLFKVRVLVDLGDRMFPCSQER